MSFEWTTYADEQNGTGFGGGNCDSCGKNMEFDDLAVTSTEVLKELEDAGWRITYDEDNKRWYHYCESCK